MRYVVTLNGKKYEVDVTETEAEIVSVSDASALPASAPAAPSAAAPAPATPPAGTEIAAGEKVLSPMPGTILSCAVTVGQPVKAGQVMFILEAMKMENEIVAPRDGVVKQILAAKGTAVDTDAPLAVI